MLSELGVLDGRAMRTAVQEGIAQGGKKLQHAWSAINLEL